MKYISLSVAFIGLCSALVGLYGSLVEYADEENALYFLLMFFGLVSMLTVVANITNKTQKIIAWPIAAIIVIVIICLSWAKGGPQAVWEKVTCDLKLSYCIDARVNRITKNFSGIHVQAFNNAFKDKDLESHRKFCIYNTNNKKAEVALFALSTEQNEKIQYDFSYTLKSETDWRIAGHDPLVTSEVAQNNVNIGRLLLPSRVDRSPMQIGPGMATIIVRVCGVPRATPGQDETVRGSFWVNLNVENIKVIQTPTGG